MEQARYWMWTNHKHGLNSVVQAPNNPSSYDDSSWEEQAFAEDASGPLGGCIWPPRSYTCSFCRREFRSAQALGGHMNVHRRDRARLKQSSSPSNNEILPPDDQNLHLRNPYTSLGFQYPSSQICAMVYSPQNPHSDPCNNNNNIVVSPSSPSMLLTTATTPQENCFEKTLFPAFSSATIKDHHKISPRSSPPSKQNLNFKSYHKEPDAKREENNSRIFESSGCTTRAKVDYFKNDLSVSLNLVVRRTRPAALSDGEEETNIGCKRRKTDASTLPFSLKSSDSLISPCSIEELDLELRLGDRPKVN